VIKSASKKYFKNFFKKIWQHQKNKFIFATQKKIITATHATHSITYRSNELV
jgi:hypothetical protein